MDDRCIQQNLLEELLLAENLRPDRQALSPWARGYSDRAWLQEVFSSRGRFLTSSQLEALLARKAKAYQAALAHLDRLPLFADFEAFVFKLQSLGVPLGLISGSSQAEVATVLEQANLMGAFATVVTLEDLADRDPPDPYGYRLALERLQRQFPSRCLQPQTCLALEDNFVGIASARAANLQVIGVAHTYPFHMLQRRAHWTVDYLTEIDLDQIDETLIKNSQIQASPP